MIVRFGLVASESQHRIKLNRLSNQELAPFNVPDRFGIRDLAEEFIFGQPPHDLWENGHPGKGASRPLRGKRSKDEQHKTLDSKDLCPEMMPIIMMRIMI